MTEDDIRELKKQLEESQEIIRDCNVKIKPFDQAIEQNLEISDNIKKEFDKVRLEHEEKQMKLRNRRADLVREKSAFELTKADEERKAERLRRAILDAEEELMRAKREEERKKRQAEANALLAKRFDEATLGLPWREWAKDHQIEAGHTITQDRYVVLADDMGLGKTLSSIITCDMAERVTKDATEEFPFLGQEEEYTEPPYNAWTQKAINAYHLGEWPFEEGSSMRERVLKETGETPFDTVLKMNGCDFVAGGRCPYLPYDLINRLKSEEFVIHNPAETKTRIVNAIKRPVGRKTLYICPAPLLRNVLEEWRRWSPARSVTYIGNMSRAERNFVLDLTLPKLDEYVIIVNYEAWRRDNAMLEKLIECQFDTIIIDEAHMIKDMKSNAYKGVKKLIDGCQPEYVIPMTGTPILNRPQELFSILTLVNPKEFYNERDFLWRYCEEYYLEGSSTPRFRFKPGGLDLLQKKIRKNFLRRTKQQAGIQLPEKVIIYHDLPVDKEAFPEQAKAREHMKQYASLVVDAAKGKTLNATVMIALITRLRQIETWPAGIIQRDPNTKEITLQVEIEESQKMDYIIRFDKETEEWEGLIPDNIDNERMVVFSQFKAPLHVLKKRIELMGKRAVIIDGDTPQAVRDESRKDFDRSITPNREDSKWDVALCNYKAAGVGLNLTAATNMIILDQEWNPGKRNQAFDRLHRIGQTENVTINVVNTVGTIDSWMESIMKDKEKIVDGFDSTITGADFKTALDEGLI